MALPVTITNFSTAVSPIGPYRGTYTPFFIVGGLIDVFLDFGTSTIANVRLSQSFTTPATATNLDRVEFMFTKVGTPTDGIQAELYATDGAGIATGPSLGFSNIILGSSIAIQSYFTFYFATKPALATNTQYAIVVSRTGALSATNYYRLWWAQSEIAAGQWSAIYSNGTWTKSVSDLAIKLWCTPDLIEKGYYIIGRDATTATNLRAIRTNSPDTSWTLSNVIILPSTILAIAGYQVGNIIHILAQVGTLSSSVSYVYCSYDIQLESFSPNYEVVAAAAAITGQASAGGGWGCGLTVRSTGEVIAFYNGVHTGATLYARVYYSRRLTYNSWSAAVQVDSNPLSDSLQPTAVLGVSDTVHFIYFNSSGAFNQRPLSAANVLQSNVPTGPGTSVSSTTQLPAVSYTTNGITLKIVAVSRYGAGTLNFTSLVFDSSLSPTNQIASINNLASLPIGIFVDSTDVYALFRHYNTNLLLYSRSVDHGASWGTSTGTVYSSIMALSSEALSHNGTIYTRGNSLVFPYTAYDGTALKYNEFLLGLTDAWHQIDKTTNFTFSNNDKTATQSFAVGGIRSTTRHRSGVAGKYYAEFFINAMLDTDFRVGISDTTALVTNVNSAFHVQSGGMYINGAFTAAPTYTTGDVVGVAWDSGAKKAWFRINGGLWNNNDASADPATGTNGVDVSVQPNTNHALWFYTGGVNLNNAVTIRARVTDLSYTTPIGFTSWIGDVGTRLTGVQANTDAGIVSISVSANTNLFGVSASSLVGAVNIGLDIPILGVSAVTSTGTFTISADANASITGVSAVTSAGTPVSISANALISGVSAVTSVEALTITGSADKPIIGVQASTAIQSLTTISSVNKPIIGVQTNALTGTVFSRVDDTVTIAGVQTTINAGTPTISDSIPITGVEAIIGIGTATIDVSDTVPITGVEATSSAGIPTITVFDSVPITGVQATTGIGTASINVSDTVPITGVQATIGIGTATINVSDTVPITGVQATTGAGTTSISLSKVLVGVQTLASVGTLGFDLLKSVSATGVQATTSVGTTSISLSKAPIGVEVTASATILSISAAKTLASVLATASAAPLTPLTSVIANTIGVSISAFVNVPKISIATSISGVAATVNTGTLIGKVDISISGVSVTSNVGIVSTQLLSNISGNSLTATAGTLQYSIQAVLPSASVIVSTSPLFTNVLKPITGVSAAISLGITSINSSPYAVISGVKVDSAASTLALTISHASILPSVEVTMSAESIRFHWDIDPAVYSAVATAMANPLSIAAKKSMLFKSVKNTVKYPPIVDPALLKYQQGYHTSGTINIRRS